MKEIDEQAAKEFKKNHPWFGKDIFAETIKHVFKNDEKINQPK